MDTNADLRYLLETLDPKARDALRRVLIHNQADRDAVTSQLLRYRDERGTSGPTSSTLPRWGSRVRIPSSAPGERRFQPDPSRYRMTLQIRAPPAEEQRPH